MQALKVSGQGYFILEDVRSSEEAKFIESIDDPARGYNGYCKVSAVYKS